MTISEFNSSVMQDLAQRWNNAFESNLDPDQCTKLVADTKNIINFFEISENTQVSIEKIADLRHAILEGFGKRGNPELFKQWFERYFSHEKGDGAVFNEVCKSLHNLFKVVVKENSTPDAFDSIKSDALQGLETFAKIDSTALLYLEQFKKSLDTNLPKDVIASVYDFMSLNDLLKLRETSSYNREIANSVLINKLNTGEISFSDLQIVTKKDLIARFGEVYSKIICFGADKNEVIANANSDTEILCFAQLSKDDLITKMEENSKHSLAANQLLISKLNKGKISFADFQIDTKKDMIALFGETSSRIIFLEIQNKNMFSEDDANKVLCLSQLATIEKLALPCFYELGTPPQDISALKYCSHLKTLIMEYNDNSDISIISHCTKLESLELGESTEVSDISFVSHFPGLKILGIGGTKVTDIKVLNHLPALEILYCSGCEIPDSDLEALRHRQIAIF